jgi:hypothetical protein
MVKDQMTDDLLTHVMKLRFLENSFSKHQILFKLNSIDRKELVATLIKKDIVFQLYLTSEYVELKETVLTLKDGHKVNTIFTEIYYDLRDVVSKIAQIYDEGIKELIEQYNQLDDDDE